MMTLQKVFKKGGILSQSFSHYEERHEQQEMAQSVKKAITQQKTLMIEAGCGVGKTFGYLVPIALTQGMRAIVSTGTRALQEQLYYKDVPIIQQYIRKGLRVVYIKGKSNYICLNRLNLLRQHSLFDSDEYSLAVDTIYAWVIKTKTGDVSEIEGISEYDAVWRDVCCSTDTCLGRFCPYANDCFLNSLRKKAKAAHIIIVNHHLFFADVMSRIEGYSVLPDYHILVFDEAHMLESIATQFLGTTVSSREFNFLNKDLETHVIENRYYNSIRQHIQQLKYALDIASRNFFCCFDDHYGKYKLETYVEYQEQVTPFITVLSAIRLSIESYSMSDYTLSIRKKLQHLATSLDIVINQHNDNTVYWVDSSKKVKFLYASPIDVSSVFREHVFQDNKRIVLTSATLSSNNSCEYISSRLGLDVYDEKIIDSPFDFKTQGRLFIPKDMPLPSAELYQSKLVDVIIQVLEKTQGRAFCLFTSYRNMSYVYQELLEKQIPYTVLCQGMHPRSQILDDFVKKSPSVLLATNTFWQGIDIQGEALSCVIIDKLPFSVPTDPIAQARMEYIDTNGGNSFYDYQVPNSIMLMRQGIGRLIRSQTDTGVVVVCDKRILTKKYGKQFLNSFPNFTRIELIDDIQVPVL